MHSVLRSAILLLIIGLPVGVQSAVAQDRQVSEARRSVEGRTPLRDVVRDAPDTRHVRAPFAVPNKLMKMGKPDDTSAGEVHEGPIQRFSGNLAPEIRANFDGSNDDDNSAVLGFRLVPPDTEGDVGPDHYVQWINSVAEIFLKDGTSILGPFAGNLFFAGMGGDCEADNDGDPIVLYDEEADRWLVSQFSVTASPYSMCVAVSQTPDPTGVYNQYEFDFGIDFPDYPKLGIWGDSYTMTTRDFAGAAVFAGISAVAMDRSAMLAGDPTSFVRFPDAFSAISDGAVPADFDGAGAAGPAVFGAHGSDGDTDFELWELDVDWSDPGSASFSAIPAVTISAYDGVVPSANQPNGQVLDDLSFFTMHRLNVRDFGSHRSMVANHSVETDPGTIGIRWYEFRDTGSGWTLYQEGTYSPDSDDRWMGSIAINAAGEIALGYSRSSSTMFPSIYMAGQTPDMSGTGILNVAETLLHAGGGSQVGLSRWGDYSMMSVDPVDDSFWFTSEYYATTASFDFNTRITNFSMGEPSDPPPMADFSFIPSDLDVDFTDNSTDNGTIVSWDWDFGDGGSSALQNPSHSYASAGVYDVTLTVTDDAGGTDGVTKSVAVGLAGTMHVSNVVVVLNRSSRVVEATVTVVDELGAPVTSANLPVSGATVSGLFSGDLSGSDSGETGGDGNVVLVSDGLIGRPTDLGFCVEDVTHPTLTYDPSQNGDPSFACDSEPPPPTGELMFVSDITTSSVRLAGRTALGQAVVTIMSDTGVLVATATVDGTFSDDVSGTDSAVTDGTGTAVLESGVVDFRPRDIGFCVDAVTHADLTYDPSLNADASFDCSTAAPALAKGGSTADEQTENVFEYTLDQNYPNPFNPTTIISYSLAETGPVRLRVFNMLGQHIATLVDSRQESGPHRVAFNADRLPAGVYLYVIEADGFQQTMRMTLLK